LFVISISELLLSYKPGVSIITTLFLDQPEETYETLAHLVSDIVLLLIVYILAIYGFLGR